MREPLAMKMYYALHIVMFPVTLAGYGLFFLGLFVRARKRPGVSGTVLASLYTRYMQHKLGTRRDEPCTRIVAAMPNLLPLGLTLLTAPTLMARRLTGYVTALYRYPYGGPALLRHQPTARTTYYDQVLEHHLPQGGNLVVLGAGFDTRAFRLPPGSGVQIFEVDTPATQAYKLEMLSRAGLDSDGISYVEADFRSEDWLEKLLQAGFDPNKPSLFTWESVCMYLDQDAVERTLRKIASTAPGSVLAFDYLSAQLLKSDSPFGTYARAALKLAGEPWTFGIDTTPPAHDRVAEFLHPCGLRLLQHHPIGGGESEGEPPEAGFAVAIVDPKLFANRGFG